MMNSNFHLILGSNSPRRKELLEAMGFSFEVKPSHVDESFPDDMDPHELPVFLSKKKADWYKLKENEVVLTADTVVVIDNTILNKPETSEEARRMLEMLSGKTHEVVTGFTIRTLQSSISRKDIARVTFRGLTPEEIEYYISTGSPFDKAGGYGIQDWLGLNAITGIEGSFYTVMGLPTHKVYEVLGEV